MCAYVSTTGYFLCNKKAPSYEKDEAYTRVTTFVHKRLAPSISASVRQHSGTDNVRHSVAAYWNMRLAVKYRKRHAMFGARLGDVFKLRFLRASHQPAAFCSFRLILLLPVKAFCLL